MAYPILIASIFCVSLFGCAPTVKVETPNEPITINLNVKIDHEIVLKVDQALDDVFEEDSDIF